LYRNGVGARAMALGGADVAWAEDALGAMAANPAALRLLKSPTLDLSLIGGIADGAFSNRANDDRDLRSEPGFGGDGAFGLPLGSLPLTFGVSVITESGLRADWRYVDTPGGVGGTSYGLQRHESELFILRSAAGLALSLGPKVSVGASIGLIYNENKLHAPYIFQTQPTLRGLKTLLDLETSGFGWNAAVGVLFRPRDDVQVGVSYKSEAKVHSYGDASGNIGAQFATLGLALRPDFRYDAEVVTDFPQMVMAGVSWKFFPRWRLALQVDWINWSDTVDELPITLTRGNNADINGVVGSAAFKDEVPLKWRDRFVYRVGLEYAVADNLWLRGGYAYGDSPVPSQTLTPLTAVIMEHTVTAGIGYRRGPVQFDAAYQFDVPTDRRVGASGLEAGEYSNSRIHLLIHWLAVTASIRF
jgi:long-chain fatty acid transport protein